MAEMLPKAIIHGKHAQWYLAHSDNKYELLLLLFPLSLLSVYSQKPFYKCYSVHKLADMAVLRPLPSRRPACKSGSWLTSGNLRFGKFLTVSTLT